MRNFIILAAILGLNLPMVSEAQDTTLFSPSAAVVDYDPFDGYSGLEDVVIEVAYSGTSSQTARLIITPDNINDFRLYGTSQPIVFEINSALGNSGPDSFDVPLNLEPSSAPQQVPLTFKIPSGQYADAGDVDVDLKVILVDDVTSTLLSSEKIITLIARTPLRAQTNFAGTSAGFENGSSFALVDFGEITAGDSRRINFQIRGNSDVDIAMHSENNGRLVNLDTPTTAFVEYTVNADGIVSDLSSPLEFMRRPEKSLNGSHYPLTISLDNSPHELFAGQYRDIITIEVTPR